MSMEDRVRETLRRRADEVVPSPDAWDAIEDRIRGSRGHPVGLWVLGAAAAAVLVAVAVVAVGTRGDDRQQVSASAPDAEELATTTTPWTTMAPPTTGTVPPSTETTVAPTTSTAPPPPASTATTAPPTTATTVPPHTGPTVTSPPTTAPPDGVPGDPEWQLGLDRLGPVRLGMTVDEAERAMGVDIETDDPDLTADCSYAYPQGGPEQVAFMLDEDRIVRFDVLGASSVRTPEGVTVGTDAEDVEAAYGDTLVKSGSDASGGPVWYHVPEDPDLREYRYAFAIADDGRVIAIWAGGADRVEGYSEGCS